LGRDGARATATGVLLLVKTVFWVIGLIAVGYGALVMGLYGAQRALLYHPSGDRPRPGPGLADATRVVEIPSHDGLPLFTWWAEPRDPEMPVIVYFHGNAGTQVDREERVAAFVARGWGVLMPTYRYNAAAGGKPSEAALIADGRAVLSWLDDRGVGPDRRVLFGESLGSGIAVALLENDRSAAAAILDAPYDSIAAVASKIYWYVPVNLLLKDRFDSLSRIGGVTVPLLIGHGGDDRIIPEAHGKRLFDAANGPKTWAFKPHAGHVDLFDHGFLDDISAFMSKVFDRPL
jgi:fermentation-respiration switch protein FrsA (DUF1100 family)